MRKIECPEEASSRESCVRLASDGLAITILATGFTSVQNSSGSQYITKYLSISQELTCVR
jgi:hypothetical protein